MRRARGRMFTGCGNSEVLVTSDVFGGVVEAEATGQ